MTMYGIKLEAQINLASRQTLEEGLLAMVIQVFDGLEDHVFEDLGIVRDGTLPGVAIVFCPGSKDGHLKSPAGSASVVTNLEPCCAWALLKSAAEASEKALASTADGPLH